MPRSSRPTRIPVPGGKVIDEYVGRVNTGTRVGRLGRAHDRPARAGTSRSRRRSSTRSPWCCAGDGASSTTTAAALEVAAGQAVVTEAGERVRYSLRRRGRRVRRGLPAGVRPRPRRTVRTDDAAPRTRIRAVPKVLLHDHLDGGLRPQTILELADERRLSRRCRRPTPSALGRVVPRERRLRVAGALPRDVRPHPRR